MHAESENEVLADREGLGKVTICECGVVSVHVGATTVRMDKSVFFDLEKMIRCAAVTLCEKSRAPNMSGYGTSSMTQ